jgi:hypothetical protein
VSTSSISAGSADRRVELREFVNVAQRPFGEISPAKIRAGLVPEEQAEFDEAWRAACLAAAETRDLTGLLKLLESWGVHALLAADLGVDGYRNLLADAEERLRTGAEPTGGMSGEQMKAMIAERLRNRE